METQCCWFGPVVNMHTAHETLTLRSTPLEQAGPDVITPLHCNRSSTALQVLLLQVVCDHSTE